MEICRYQGKEVCAYDLKDSGGIYDQEQVLNLKRAAAKGELSCVECGQRVYLAAGLIKEPYFAHYDLDTCSYSGTKESEESKTAKRLLYQLAKRSFPEQEISMRYRQAGKFYSTICIHDQNEPMIAVDYQIVMLPIQELEKRVEFYQQQSIQPLIVLSSRQKSSSEQLNWYQTYVQELTGYCIILNASEQTILVKRSFLGQYGRFRQARVFAKEYPIQEITIGRDGKLSIDFLNECLQKEREILKNLEERSKQEELSKLRKSEFLQEQVIRVANEVDFSRITLPSEYRKDILEQCILMIRDGDMNLVSEKYLKFILSFYSELKKK